MSRDRSGEYADGTALRASQAVQVAERWHQLRNLGDVAERVLAGIFLSPIPVEQTEPARTVPSTPQPEDRETLKDAESRERLQQQQRALDDEVHEPCEKTKSIRAVAAGIDQLARAQVSRDDSTPAAHDKRQTVQNS